LAEASDERTCVLSAWEWWAREFNLAVSICKYTCVIYNKRELNTPNTRNSAWGFFYLEFGV